MARGLFGEAANQLRALDDQVGTFQRNLCGAPVGKKLKFADFVDDRSLAHFAKQGTHVVGDNQRARRGIERFGPFQNLYGAPGLREKSRGKKTGGGAANDRDLASRPTSLFDFLPQNDRPAPQHTITSRSAHRAGNPSSVDLQFPTNVGSRQLSISAALQLIPEAGAGFRMNLSHHSPAPGRKPRLDTAV